MAHVYTNTMPPAKHSWWILLHMHTQHWCNTSGINSNNTVWQTTQTRISVSLPDGQLCVEKMKKWGFWHVHVHPHCVYAKVGSSTICYSYRWQRRHLACTYYASVKSTIFLLCRPGHKQKCTPKWYYILVAGIVCIAVMVFVWYWCPGALMNLPHFVYGPHDLRSLRLCDNPHEKPTTLPPKTQPPTTISQNTPTSFPSPQKLSQCMN